MQSTKKLISVLILVLLCTGLTGCSLEKKLNEIGSGMLLDSVNSTLASDSVHTMSQSTKDAQDAVVSAANKVSEQTTTWNPLKAITSDNACMPWNEDAQRNKLDARLSSKKDVYETAKATDEVYQSSISANKERKAVELKKYLPVILIVAIILVALFILPKLFKKKPVPAPAPAPAQPPADVERSGQLKVNYERQLRNNCAKLGLDYDQTLADYGGDARKATESTMLMMR